MLEKIAGVAMLTKLRAILLLEADFNQHNKLIFQHRMLDLARKNGLVPEEIFSEKGKTAEDAILQQVLMYDIARITKRPLLVAQVDASQCYDRVAHAMAALTLRAFRVHNSSVLGMLRPLHCMEFYLRTGFGQSSSFCGGATEGKHGLAQGNGAAPATWQQISTLMINAQHRQGHGVKIYTPISRQSIQQVGILYVDDTNLLEGLGEKDDVPTVADKGQKGITNWGDKLIAVGGALNPDKCKWTLHHMESDGKGSWVYTDQTTGNSDDGEGELEELTFTVPRVNAEAAQIDRLRTNEAVENLGLYARPDGSSERHFEEIREKITTWTSHIQNGVLPTRSVWMSYTHQLWAGLRYGLGACSASMTALSKGLGSADYYLLSNLGVVRSITREWRCLPASFGGMELFDLTTETTAATLNSFLQHYGSNTNIGITLLAALEYLQLEIGVDDCPFHYDFDTWGHLATDSWVKALWEKVDKLGITLLLEYTSIPIPRENDNTIMSAMVTMGYRGKELKSINRVRIAQEALFVSDITTANGKYIEAHLQSWWVESLEGDMGEHRSKLQFSREDPTAADWKIWKKALQRLTSGPNLLLNNPLGKWRAPSPRIWRQFYHPELNIGELRYDDRTLHFENHPDDRAHILTYARVSDTALSETIPVTFEDAYENKIKIKSRGPKLVESIQQNTSSFLELLKSKGGEWMWKELIMEDDPDWIVEALERGSLHCVTDGSHNPKLAPHISGAAWVLRCSHSNNELQGDFSEQSSMADSYRAEQLGMLAIHLLLLTTEEYYQRTLTDANIFCDNQGTIITFSKEHQRVPSGARNSDILRVLRRIQASSKLAHKLKHVKAHQDDNLPLHVLSLAAQLNISCDRRAKWAVQKAIQTEALDRATIYTLPMESASVFIDGVKQTSDVTKELRYQIGRAQARQFYADEKIMDNATFDSISWLDLRSLLSKRPKMYQLWFSKQCSGFCGTGQMITRWDKEASSNCPNCGCFETADHLNRCNNRIRRELLRESILDLQTWLVKHCSHPELCIWIPRYLFGQGRRLFVDLVHPDGRTMSQQMRKIGNAVDKIGWRHFTEGKLPLSLKLLQHQHLLSQHTQITIDIWMKGLIDQLLTLTHTQWICRNLTKHHKTMGTKALTARDEIQKEVEKQLSMGFSDLPSTSRCLLEISPEQLFGMGTSEKQYWLNAAEAARTAANNALHISEGQSNSWSEVMKTPTYKARAEQRQQSTSTLPPDDTSKVKSDAPNKPSKAPNKPPKAPKRRRTQSQSNETTLPGTTGGITDRIELLRRNNPIENTQVSIGSLLAQPTNQASASDLDLRFRHSAESVAFASFKTLNPGLWIKGDVINAFVTNILRPKFSNRKVHFFSSYFFSKLLGTGPTGTLPPVYNFHEVRRWGNNLRGNIFGRKELIIPINHCNTHWLCLKASMERKSIGLWDPFGRKESNQLYLNSMKRYLRDKYHDTFPDEDADAWISDWTLSDNSENCPQQTNSFDCGIFSIANMTLLAQNITLSSNSYSENDFQTLDTRKRVAYLLWKASSNHPQPSQAPRPLPDRALPTKRPAPSKPKTSTTTKTTTTSSSSKERNKRRRKSGHHIIAGGTRTRGKISYTDPGPIDQLQTLLNRKRNANSIAIEESSLTETTQRHVPKKRRKPPPT